MQHCELRPPILRPKHHRSCASAFARCPQMIPTVWSIHHIANMQEVCRCSSQSRPMLSYPSHVPAATCFPKAATEICTVQPQGYDLCIVHDAMCCRWTASMWMHVCAMMHASLTRWRHWLPAVAAALSLSR